MKFLVFGASGMAGHMIALYLKEQGHNVVGFSRKKVSFLDKQVNGDAQDRRLVRETIEEGSFDVVINAIGILNTFAEKSPEVAMYLNGKFPHMLARMVEDIPTRLFHMSTDCVFAGNTGPYTEKSIPDGRSVYDRTKAAGELKDGKSITFRNSIVGPDLNPSGIGLLNWFMEQTGPIGGYTHAMWTGLTTLELAKAMESAAHEQISGLVNMVPEGNISKYELLSLFNKELRNNPVEIYEDDSVNLDKTLVRTNFDLTFRPSSYPKQIADLACWMQDHKQLYPHYALG